MQKGFEKTFEWLKMILSIISRVSPRAHQWIFQLSWSVNHEIKSIRFSSSHKIFGTEVPIGEVHKHQKSTPARYRGVKLDKNYVAIVFKILNPRYISRIDVAEDFAATFNGRA